MDSFDDRIDDDLFEFIISYLQIKDKLRYESVSKRFQRLVFNKQNVLTISSEEDSVDNLCEHHLRQNGEIDILKLERLLEKFRFITTIEFDITYSNPTKVLKTITQNCTHLTSISCNYIDVQIEVLKDFCEKFGQQLRHISFSQYYEPSIEDIEYLLKNSPKLLSIKDMNVEYITEDDFEFKRLTKISLEMKESFDDENKSPVSAQNIKNLEYLSIRMLSKDPNKYLFNEITKLKYLKVFKIESKSSELGDEVWAKHIETIATNCVGLQCFEFKLNHIFQDINPNICLRSISFFSGLKILRICINCEQPITDLSLLKNCKSLVILKLSVKFINENIFDEIHLIVPQLRKLSINALGGLQMTDKGLNSIAKLKCLTHLRLKYFELDITAKGFKNLIDSCERLKEVNIYYSCIPESYFGYKKRDFSEFIQYLRLKSYIFDIIAKGFEILINSCQLRKYVHIFHTLIFCFCPRFEKREIFNIIKHYEKYQKRVETRDEVNTKPLKCFWILWNRMKQWIEYTDTKQRSHCIDFYYNFEDY